MKSKKIIGIVCIIAFVITALTSIPLFINYVRGVEPGNRLIVDVHVWVGAVFIIIASIRMTKNKAFMNVKSKK